MNFLRVILLALLDWFEKRAEKPRTLEDANTPPTIREKWATSLKERLKDKV